jgi:hypothetical protein
MPRPDSISNEDISRWSNNIDNDTNLPISLAESPVIREVCYAGLWLCEQLEKLNCPEEYIVRIQFAAGQLSFGRDPWDAHQKVLEAYKLNELDFEQDITELN